jgi:hypothetical protein
VPTLQPEGTDTNMPALISEARPCKYNVKKMVETAFGLGILTLYQIEPHTSLPHLKLAEPHQNLKGGTASICTEKPHQTQPKRAKTKREWASIYSCKDHQILKTLSLMPKTSGFNSG